VKSSFKNTEDLLNEEKLQRKERHLYPRLTASIGTIDEEEQSEENSSFPWMLDIGQN